MPKTIYEPVDAQQRTFVQQFLVDTVILIRNVSMIALASRTECQGLFKLSVIIIVTSYLTAKYSNSFFTCGKKYFFLFFFWADKYV